MYFIDNSQRNYLPQFFSFLRKKSKRTNFQNIWFATLINQSMRSKTEESTNCHKSTLKLNNSAKLLSFSRHTSNSWIMQFFTVRLTRSHIRGSYVIHRTNKACIKSYRNYIFWRRTRRWCARTILFGFHTR